MGVHFGVSGVRELITGTHLDVIKFPAPIACQLNRIRLSIAAANSAGDTLFDVKKNGTTIYGDPADRPKILAGATVGSSFPAVTLAEGDMVSVDVVSAPLGGISGLFALVQIQDSPTVAQYITDAYAGALGRAPDAGELSGATTDLQAACTAETTLDATLSLFTDIFTGAEYLALSTTNTVYVEDLYQAVLGRPSDPGGLSYWVAQIGGGATRAEVLGAFNSATDHVNRVTGWCPNTLPGTNAIQLQGFPISDATPDEDDTWHFESGVWVPGPAAGGLGAVVLSGTPTSGQVPTATSGTAATWQTPAGSGTARPSSADAPFSESGLQLWLRADLFKVAPSDGDHLTNHWFDLSANQFDARLITSTAWPSILTAPKYEATAGPNSQGSLLFTSIGWLQLPSFLKNAWTGFELIVVCKMPNNGSGTNSDNGLPYGAWGTGVNENVFFSDGSWYDNTGQGSRFNTGNPAADMTAWRCVVITITPSTVTTGWTMKIDNTTHFQATSGAFAFGRCPQIASNIGNGIGTNLFHTGRIAEMIVFNSTGHRANLLSYLNTRYGFSLT